MFWRYRNAADPPSDFRPFRRRAYRSVCSRPVPIAIEDFETAAAELRDAQPSSGGVAESPVELGH